MDIESGMNMKIREGDEYVVVLTVNVNNEGANCICTGYVGTEGKIDSHYLIRLLDSEHAVLKRTKKGDGKVLHRG